jgi:hypothetical protein
VFVSGKSWCADQILLSARLHLILKMKKLRLPILLLPVIVLFACHQSVNEEDEIKKLLEKESATWRSGDGKAHAECWEIKPYSRILVSTTDGKTFDIPPAAMADPKNVGNGGTSANSNYKISIHGTYAWVNHDEVSTGKDGKKTYSHEIRILEKYNNTWKLVGQSIHQYLPELPK